MNKEKIIQALKPYAKRFVEIMKDTRGCIDLSPSKTKENEKEVHTKKIGKMNFTVESHFKKGTGCDIVEKFRRLIKI